MTKRLQTYTNELLLALRMHDVPGPRIAEALAEVHSHVTESGEDPRETFGSPQAYAKELSAVLGARVSPAPFWRSLLSWTSAVFGIGGAVGAWLLLDGGLAMGADERGWLGLPAAVTLLTGLVVLVALAVRLRRMAGDADIPVLDPRTGADMTPPWPRWLLPVLVATPVLSIVLAAVVAVAQR